MEERASQDLHLVREALAATSRRSAHAGRPLPEAGRQRRLALRRAARRDRGRGERGLVKAYRNLHRFRPDHPFSTWLYRLAANHVDRPRPADAEGEPARTRDPRADLTDPAPARRRRAGTERAGRTGPRGAWTQLPHHYREVLFLVYIEGHEDRRSRRDAAAAPGNDQDPPDARPQSPARGSSPAAVPDYFGDARCAVVRPGWPCWNEDREAPGPDRPRVLAVIWTVAPAARRAAAGR